MRLLALAAEAYWQPKIVILAALAVTAAVAAYRAWRRA